MTHTIGRIIAFAAVTATAATVCLASAAGAAAPSARDAMPTFTRGAGYVPTLDELGRTRIKLVVPDLPCSSGSPDRSVRVGMFGAVRRNQHEHGWSEAVTVRCRDGRLHTTNSVGGGIKIHVGDVVVMSQDRLTSSSIVNVTTGRGVGGSSSGPTGHPSPRVLFGARFGGTPGRSFDVDIRNAVAHGKTVGKLHPSRHTQRRKNGHVVAKAGDLGSSGRFTVTAAPKPTPSRYTLGAGYVAQSKHLGNTRMKFVVPDLPCSANSPDRSVTVGMFGSTKIGRHRGGWNVYARVTCTDGKRRATTSLSAPAVHVGDVVVVTQRQKASTFLVQNKTTGKAVGVGGGVAGKQPRLRHRALFGVRFSGTPGRPFPVEIRNATAHDKPIGTLDTTRHTQRRDDGRAVASAGPLDSDGRGFTVTVR